MVAILNSHGREVSQKSYDSHFDLLVDGWRVEVKSANCRIVEEQPLWLFNLHRHGKLKEDYDFYILQMNIVPFCKGCLYLLVKAPMKRLTFTVTFRKLLGHDAVYAIEFQKFARGFYGKKGGIGNGKEAQWQEDRIVLHQPGSDSQATEAG